MSERLRAAQPGRHRISIAAVRFCLLLLLLVITGASAFAQGLSPGNAITFGTSTLGTSVSVSQQFTGPAGGVDIKSITAVTMGVPDKDFSVVSNTCIGTLTLPNNCKVTLNFTPSQIGVRLGAMIVTNSNGTVVNTIYLSGVGLGPQFALSPAAAVTTASSSTLSPTAFTAGAGVLDGSGNLFFTDVLNGRILERSPANVYTEVLSLAVNAASGITIDGAGNLYVSSGSSVYSIAPGTATATVLATPGVTLSRPTGLAMDSSGDLYIADAGSSKIYQVLLNSDSTAALTLAGPGASLSAPTGLNVFTYGDVHGNIYNDLYIADSANNRVVEVPLGNSTNTATVVTIAPALSNPTGVTLDAAGTLYIANTGASNVVESTATGSQFVFSATGLALSSPAGIVIQPSGSMTIADSSFGLIDIARSAAAITFPTPTVVGTLDAADDPLNLTVQSTGNVTSTLNAGPDPSFGGAQPGAFLLAGTSTCPSISAGAAATSADTFAVGQVCTYALDFQPTVVGPNNASLTLTTSGSGISTTNTPTLLGTGLSTIDHFVLVATPSTIDLNGSVTLTLTAVQKNGAIATDYVGTVTFTDTDPNGVFLGGTSPNSATTTYTFTAADNGVLTIPAVSGLQLNQLGTFTAHVVDNSTPTPYAATSNPINVVEPSTLTLTSSVNPSLINTSTTFTLHVATTGTVPPGGSVTFYSNGVAIGSAPLGTNGSASLPYSFSTAGSYAITATYTSTTNTQGGTASLTQVVGNATMVTLTSSINPSYVGQTTTLSATITAFAPTTGTITFYNGGTALGTVTVSGTSATLPVSFSTAGTYALTAVYTSTDASITGATSAPLSQVVENTSQLTLSSSINPSQLNQVTTLTAILSALGTPAGSVTFYDGATALGTAPLVGVTATLPASFSTSGTHTLKAVYTSSNTSTENATSAPLLQVVLNLTTITLTSSVNPSQINQSTTLTAFVKSAGTPTGTVTFQSNGATLGTATINGGVAALTVSFARSGNYSLTAVYGGDSNNQTATSAPLTQVVLNVATIALTSSVNPILLSNPTILTAVATSAGPVPTGTISFFDGTTPIGSGTLVNGTLSLSASFVYAGSHNLTASYSGDAATAPATSPVFVESVGDFTINVASGGSSSASEIAAGTASYALALNPVFLSNLPSGVTLAVSGLPAGATGVLNPTAIATGAGTTPISLTVTAAPITAALHGQPRRSPLHYAPIALGFLALPLAWIRRRKRFGSILASLCLLLVLTGGISGCATASTGYYGQTPQTYNLTVTATSGNLIRSVYLTLTIQ